MRNNYYITKKMAYLRCPGACYLSQCLYQKIPKFLISAVFQSLINFPWIMKAAIFFRLLALAQVQ